MKKIIMVVMFSLSLLVSTIGSCYAFSEQVPDFVTKQIDCIYSSDFNYDIINNNGVSIKDNFIAENQVNYELGNYENIYNYIIDNELVLVMSKVTASRSSNTKNLTKIFTHSYRFSSEKAITFGVECYAVIRVNESTGVITSFSGPSVSMYSPAGGGAVSEKLYDINTSYKWGSASHRSIDFTYRYGYERVEAGSYGMATTYRTPYYTSTIHGE